MAAETNTIMQADLARVRVVDFGIQFAGFDVRFTVSDGVLTVCEIVAL